jgi:tetratricopeptide (TPR) repeat protein
MTETGSLEQALRHGAGLLERDPEAAAGQAREILRLRPFEARAHRLLGRALRRLDRIAEADAAEISAIEAAAHDPLLREAGAALAAGRLQTAERLLRSRLGEQGDDVAATLLLAEIALAYGIAGEAEKLVRKALLLAPAFAEARLRLATILAQQNRIAESIEALDGILARKPDDLAAGLAKAATLSQVGAYDEAVALLETMLAASAGEAASWLAYGNVLKTLGRIEESAAAYRRALACDPGSGEAYWSLANVKTGLLGAGDVAAMTAELRTARDDTQRLHLHFALGTALEQVGDYPASFAHYADGNRLRRAQLPYSAAATHEEVQRTKALFTREFLAERTGSGCDAPDPIFILGLPRAGSTLVEQILASHSLVEGTAELPVVPMLVQTLLAERWREPATRYPDLLATLGRERLRELGREYLEAARLYRRTQRPFFIDKLPNNWLNLGFIRLILPGARIVDARRHPLDCCFSNFKQYFARGQAFSYDLGDLGLYYRDYAEALAHFDDVLDGRIHRVVHERLVEQPEAEIRLLLDGLDLPFEQRCLRFHENERAVRTASAAQVRRPISRAGIGQWRPFEPWLDPLKDALGPAIDAYPDAP